MKIIVQSVLFITPESLRKALDINLACNPICWSAISPSNSTWGTSAATESTTTKSIAPERTSVSAISKPCSPLSGCERINSSILTPRFLA